jgi:cellulose synthase (UDP-forming)
MVQCTFARPDSWTHWNRTQDVDRPLLGLQEIASLGLRGYRTLGRALLQAVRERAMRRKKTIAASA